MYGHKATVPVSVLVYVDTEVVVTVVMRVTVTVPQTDCRPRRSSGLCSAVKPRRAGASIGLAPPNRRA